MSTLTDDYGAEFGPSFLPTIASTSSCDRHVFAGSRKSDPPTPSLFAAALKAAKATLDPLGLLNPGVLIDP